MANLRLNFEDAYSEIGKYLGQQTLSAADTIICKDIVKRGYRQFLCPLDLSTGKLHCWKFLEKTTTLSTTADEDTYKLPVGFSSFEKPFTYTTPISINPTQMSLTLIYEKKSKQTGSGYPRYFALKTGDYDEINGQRWEVVFWPPPNGTYNYYYTYTYTPPAPVNDDDIFVGGELASEAILECCLSVAEIRKTDKEGVHTKRADRLVQQLIGMDKRASLTPYLGQMADGGAIDYVRSSVIYDSEGTQVLPEP